MSYKIRINWDVEATTWWANFDRSSLSFLRLDLQNLEGGGIVSEAELDILKNLDGWDEGPLIVEEL